MRRFGVGFIVAMLFLALAAPAVAHEKAKASMEKKGAAVYKARYTISGKVAGMDVGAGKMSVAVTKGTKAVRRMAKAGGGAITMSFGDYTAFKGARPEAIGAGSWVKVLAAKSPEGMMAKKVMVGKVEPPKKKEPQPQEYMKLYGTNMGWDPEAKVLSLKWSEVDPWATAWLQEHGSPNPVSIFFTDSTVVYGMGEQVWVKARPSADGSRLEAIYVK